MQNELLDLVIADIESVSVVVASQIADHAVLLASFNMSIPETVAQWRQAWMYTKADWDEFKRDLRGTDWNYMGKCSASKSAARTTNLILSCAERYIPRKRIYTKRVALLAHGENRSASGDKHAASGTSEYEAVV